MTHEIVPAGAGDVLRAELDELSLLSTEELKAELARAMEITVAALRRMAAIVRVLEERGEDLSDLKNGLLHYLRRIAYEQCLPETVVRFGNVPILVRNVSKLPLPDQRKLAGGEPVPLVVRGPDGRFELRQADPLGLSGAQVAQVFAPDHVRDQSEQILWLEMRGMKPARKPRRSERVRPSPTGDGVIVGKVHLPSALVVEALAALRGPAPGDDEDLTQVGIRMTEAEHVALKKAAADGGTNVSLLVRRALRAYGLFGKEVSDG
jgi:hypothetical protein